MSAAQRTARSALCERSVATRIRRTAPPPSRSRERGRLIRTGRFCGLGCRPRKEPGEWPRAGARAHHLLARRQARDAVRSDRRPAPRRAALCDPPAGRPGGPLPGLAVRRERAAAPVRRAADPDGARGRPRRPRARRGAQPPSRARRRAPARRPGPHGRRGARPRRRRGGEAAASKLVDSTASVSRARLPVLALTAAAALLTGCGNGARARTSSPPRPAVEVGYRFGCDAAGVADRVAFAGLRRNGIAVHVRELGGVANAVVALVRGEVQLATVPYSTAIRAADEGAHIRVVLGENMASDFVLVARPGIDSVAALRGRRVVVDGQGLDGDTLVRVALAPRIYAFYRSLRFWPLRDRPVTRAEHQRAVRFWLDAHELARPVPFARVWAPRWWRGAARRT